MAAVRRGAWVVLRYVTTIFFLGVVYGAPLMLLLVLVAWPARRLLVAWIVLAVLAFFQAILAAAGYQHWGLGMFHPVNAVILLALSGRLAHYAWTTGKSAEAAEAPAAVPTG